VSAQGKNENNQDAEDLYQEAMTRVVQGLNQVHSPARANIENFELYVSRLAGNVCTDFLRTKSPATTRLKYRLRDLLKRHKDFDLWQLGGRTLCGFASWRDGGKSAFVGQSAEEFEGKLDSFKSLYFADEDIQLAPLSKVVAELFDWILGPVEINQLAQMIASLLDIKDQQLERLEDPSASRRHVNFVSNTQSGESHVTANELLARLWQALTQLPTEQRDSFALGFADEAGQDLFTVLLAAEIVSWDELANGMGRSVEQMARLRLRMPLDSAAIADELKSALKNVYKWRFRAIRRLKTELGQ